MTRARDVANIDGLLTTTGDTYYASAASTPARLGIGSTGQLLTVAGGVPTWATLSSSSVNSNKIINGNFAINQRNYVSAANLSSGSYGLDRWKSNYTNTTLTFTPAVNGQSVTINQNGVIRQIVENVVISSGNHTLSWEGTATGRVYNSGGSAPSYAASPITVNLDGLADVIVEFTATGGTKTLSKVKLEEGSSATAFVLAGLTAAGELLACYRYFYALTGSYQVYPASVSGTTNAFGVVFFPVTMRTNATMSLAQTGWAVMTGGGGGSTLTTTAMGTNDGNTQTMSLFATVSSGLTNGQGTILKLISGTNTASAEL
jgi:hypothetical protein